LDRLLTQALRCGLTIGEFWELTPHEVYLSIDAYLWRTGQQQRHDFTVAWLNAKLQRAKKIPSLKVMLMDKKAQKLTGKELAKRRDEFKQMTKDIDLTKIKVKNG
jgi:hypothetical protein